MTTQVIRNARANAERQFRHVRPLDFDEATYFNARVELAKVGHDTEHDFGHGRAAALAERASLRRALNEIRTAASDHSEKAKAGDKQAEQDFGATIEALEWASARINDISQQMDDTAAAELMFTGRSASSTGGWRKPNGDEVTVLDSTDKLVNHTRHRVDPDEHVGFGELIRAVAMGPKSDRVRNALTSTDAAAGGVTVPEQVLDEFIDTLRSKTRTVQAGARTLLMDEGNTRIVRAESDPTSGWRAENAVVAEGDPAFSGLEFKAKTLASLVKVPVELLQDSVNIDRVLMELFAGALAVELDRAALVGSGVSPEPLGVWDTVGVNEVLPAPVLSYDALLDGWDMMSTANAEDPTAAIMNPTALRTLRGLKDSTGRYLRPPEALINTPLLGTTSLAADQVIVGDWTRLVLGIRQQLRVQVHQQTFADRLQVAFIAYLRADTGVETAKSFTRFNIAP